MNTTAIDNSNRSADAPAFLIHEPAEVYHSKAGEYLSSHLLIDFEKCPELYWKKITGQIVDEDRPAYVVGRAAHTLILEGREQFDREYEVGGPINPKTGAPFGPTTKAFAEWQAQHGKAVLTEKQYELICKMAYSVSSHLEASELLREGVAEAVVRTEYCGEPSQIRIDWYCRGIVDLKTCDDLTWFEADARRYGYAHQLAFYRAVLNQASGLPAPVYIIGVEKKPPHRTGVWRFSDDTLRIAQQENEAAIRRLQNCRDRNHFPTGYEQVRLLDLN